MSDELKEHAKVVIAAAIQAFGPHRVFAGRRAPSREAREQAEALHAAAMAAAEELKDRLVAAAPPGMEKDSDEYCRRLAIESRTQDWYTRHAMQEARKRILLNRMAAVCAAGGRAVVIVEEADRG